MNQIKDIFESLPCISEEQMMRYMEEKLSSAEKHEVEKHLMDCELCSDALEGIKMIAGREKFSEITSGLYQQIQHRVEEKRTKVFFLKKHAIQLVVAASLIILLGLVWNLQKNMSERMLQDNSENIVAERIEPPLPNAEAKKDVSVKLPVPSEENTIAAPMAARSNKPVRSISSPPLVSATANAIGSMKKENNARNNKLLAAPESMHEQAVGIRMKSSASEKQVNIQSSHPEMNPPVPAVAVEQNTGTKIVDSLLHISIQDIAVTYFPMEKYDQIHYSKAADNFEKSVMKNPADYDALFFSAVSYMGEGRMDEAMTNLRKVLNTKNEKFYDDAKWCLALVYIKKRDVQDARSLLSELQQNIKSKYHRQAVIVLKELH